MVRDTLYLINELGDSPIFFYLFDISWSLSNCSESVKKSVREKILGANVLKRRSATQLTLSLLLVLLEDAEFVCFGVTLESLLLTGVLIAGSASSLSESSSSSSSLLSSEKLSSSDSLGKKLWSDSSSSSPSKFCTLLLVEASGISCDIVWPEYPGWVILCCDWLCKINNNYYN